MLSPTISVIIPTYNHANFVEETLLSVLSQTFENYEIIIVNDGSPDNTNEIIAPYLGNPRLKYYEKNNGGQASARNFGLKKSAGKFISFLDDDDIWPEDKLEWQLNYLIHSNALAIGGACGFIESGNIKSFNDDDYETKIDFNNLFSGNPFVSPGQLLFRASSLIDINGFDEDIWGLDDLDLYMRLSLKGDIIKKSKLSLWYRKHESNASLDIERMFKNSGLLITKNSVINGESSKKLVSVGHKWLHKYLGRKIIDQIKGHTKRLEISKAAKLLQLIGKVYSTSLLHNFELQKMILKDFLPYRIKELLK